MRIATDASRTPEMKRWLLALVATCIAVITGAEAQPGSTASEPVVLPAVAFIDETDTLTPAEVVRLLSAPDQRSETPARTRTRAVRLVDPESRDATLPERFRPGRTITATVARATPRVHSAGAIALPLRFNFNSTDVLASGTRHLDAIAIGIQQLPSGALVYIEGHTDAHGSDALNNELSLRRALAVRSYLMREHRIPGAMLVAIGRGKNAPLMADNPYASANRRVEFRAEHDPQVAAVEQPAPANEAGQLATMVLGRPGDAP